MKYLLALCILLTGWCLLFCQPAMADVTVYTNRAAFTASSTGLTNLGFEGLAPPGGGTYYGNPGTLTLGGVSFNTNNFLFVQNVNYYNTGAFLSAQQGGPVQVLNITLPQGATSVGSDYGGGQDIVVTLSTGQTYTFGGKPFPALQFFGFTSTVPITSMRITVNSGVDLDNFTFGTAVFPIPTIDNSPTGPGAFSPISVAAGGPDFTLTVHGTNFVPASVVQWNLQNLPTTFVSSTELSVGVPAAFIANPGAAAINVVNPPGDLAHTSITAYFAITQPNPANVTAQMSVTRSGFRFVRATGHFVQTVTVRNVSNSAYSGPLHLLLDSLSSNATLFNRTGLTTYYLPLNSPYLSNTLTGTGNGDTVFNPGESVTFTLEFTNPTNAAITYTPRLLAGSGTPL